MSSSSGSNLDKIAIRNILSIRYNPLEKPFIKPAKWQDYTNEVHNNTRDKLQELLVKSTLDKLSDQKTIAISLSGGIDSTLCLGLIRHVFPEKKVIGICGVFAGGFDESIVAKRVADKFNADFHIVHVESVFTHMPEIITITKKPKWNTYIHLIAKYAKKFTNTLVTGDGSDELFGGYTFRYRKFLNLLSKNDNWKIRTINYLECHNRDWVPDQERMFGPSIKFDWEAIYKYFKPFFQNKLHPLKQIMLADFNGKLLHDFIPMGKAIAAYYNIRSFPIFLDPDVISFASRLPIEQKYDQRSHRGKQILREIADNLGVKHMDEKRGFSPSLFTDWKEHGREVCTKYLLDEKSNIYRKKLININWVRRAFHTVDDDGDIRYLNRLISILALEIWYRVIITKEIKPTNKL